MLYETLGPTLPEGLAGAAALWGLAHRCAMTYPDAVRRAGHADGNALFDAILDWPLRESRSRVDEYEDDFELHRPPGQADRARDPGAARRAARAAATAPERWTSDEFPIVLSVGERRSSTANDIFRDPGWRKRDADGALRVSARGRRARSAWSTAAARG